MRRAAADGGLALGEIDGLLVSSGISPPGRVSVALRNDLDMTGLRLLSEMNAFGATAGAMVAYAAAAVTSDAANAVACVFADALAQLRDPPSLAEYQASRWIAEPLHLMDCCLVSNGGAAGAATSPPTVSSCASGKLDERLRSLLEDAQTGA